VYEEPERTIVASEVLHAVTAHRRRGEPLTPEAGVVRVADALDLAKGRSCVPFESRRPNIHSLSAAAIDRVKIESGDERAVRIEIAMNNSAGIFQVDELLATKAAGLLARGARRGRGEHRRRAREAARAGVPHLDPAPGGSRGGATRKGAPQRPESSRRRARLVERPSGGHIPPWRPPR